MLALSCWWRLDQVNLLAAVAVTRQKKINKFIWFLFGQRVKIIYKRTKNNAGAAGGKYQEYYVVIYA